MPLKIKMMNQETSIHGDVTGAQFSACNIYIYGNATGCQFNRCYVEKYDGKKPKIHRLKVFDKDKEKLLEKYEKDIVTYKNTISQFKNTISQLQKELNKLQLKTVRVKTLEARIDELVKYINNNIKYNVPFESQISDLKDKISILLEVNHSQAQRIRELERSHDNNFNENWEFYPSKKIVKELSEIFTTWLDCEDP